MHDPAERSDLEGHPYGDDSLLAVACLVLDVGQVEEGNVFLIPMGEREGEGRGGGGGEGDWTFLPKYVYMNDTITVFVAQSLEVR